MLLPLAPDLRRARLLPGGLLLPGVCPGGERRGRRGRAAAAALRPHGHSVTAALQPAPAGRSCCAACHAVRGHGDTQHGARLGGRGAAVQASCLEGAEGDLRDGHGHAAAAPGRHPHLSIPCHESLAGAAAAPPFRGRHSCCRRRTALQAGGVGMGARGERGGGGGTGGSRQKLRGTQPHGPAPVLLLLLAALKPGRVATRELLLRLRPLAPRTTRLLPEGSHPGHPRMHPAAGPRLHVRWHHKAQGRTRGSASLTRPRPLEPCGTRLSSCMPG